MSIFYCFEAYSVVTNKWKTCQQSLSKQDVKKLALVTPEKM